MTYIDILLLLLVLLLSFFAASVLRLKFLGCGMFWAVVGALLVMKETLKASVDLYFWGYKTIAVQIVNPFKKIIFPFFLLIQVIKIIPAVNEIMSHGVHSLLEELEEAKESNSSRNESQVDIVKANFVSQISFA